MKFVRKNQNIQPYVDTIFSVVQAAKADPEAINATAGCLYDEEGNRIESSRIHINISSINVTQEILFSKEVPVVYEFTGTPEEGYALTGEVITDYDTVKVCGRRSLLDNISTIYVRSEDLDVTGEHTNKTVELNLRDYLPASVDFADKTFDGNVVVTAIIRRETYTIITADIADVRIEGVPEEASAEIISDGTYVEDGKVKIRIYGLSEYLAEVDEAHLNIVLDLNEYAAQNGMTSVGTGTYHIVPTISLPEGVHLEDGCTITVRVY